MTVGTKRPLCKCGVYVHEGQCHKWVGYKAEPVINRVWRKVQVGGPDECWPWTGKTAGPERRGQIAIYIGRRASDNKSMYKYFYVARLIAGAKDDEVTRHTCDNPPCCNPAHLTTGTLIDNSNDMVRRDRAALAKLTCNDVRAIRADPRLQADIARDYGITAGQVGRVKRHQAWKNID